MPACDDQFVLTEGKEATALKTNSFVVNNCMCSETPLKTTVSEHDVLLLPQTLP